MSDKITIAQLDAADIEDVGPLWKALMHHVAALPEALVPVRPSEESWVLERAVMLEALAGDAFVLVARRVGQPVGYAFVTVEGPDPVWYTGDSRAELAHLVVAEGERGDGIGSALMDAVDAELERRGIEDVEIGVDTGNEGAERLYESRGYRADFRIFYGSPGRKRWACLRREAEDRKAGRGRFAPPAAGGAPQPTPRPQLTPRPQPRPSEGGPMSNDPVTSPPRYVSVIGASRATAELVAEAERLGELLADRGCVVVCGGRDGVMAAVARGVKRRGGVTIGILSEADRLRVAPELTYSVCSAVGHARNLAVVASGDVVIAVGGAWGTLSEIGLARSVGKPVILLDTWEMTPPEGGELDGVRRATSPAEAVELALTLG